MRYLSVCSGIEAASVAFHHYGWSAVAFSEIDKAISQVWNWGFWFGSNGGNCWVAGHEKTELAAKNALLAKARDWLRDAGMEA